MDEQFSEPEPNLIEGTEGFCIRVLGETGLRYLEGERSVWIDFEVLATPGGIAMAKDSIPYWEGPGAELVDETARNRIAGNIKRAEAMTPAQLSLWASCYPSGAGSQMWKGFGSRRQAVVEPRSSSFGPFRI